MKILLTGLTSHSVFIRWLKSSLEQRGWEVDIYHFDNILHRKLVGFFGVKWADKTALFVYLLLNWLKNFEVYQAISLNYASSRYVPLLGIFRMFSRKIILTTWGSDFYRSSEQEFLSLQQLYHKIPNLIYSNNETGIDCCDKFELDRERVSIVRFPLSIIDVVDDIYQNEERSGTLKYLTFPVDKVVVVCGTNGSVFQNHFAILQQILNLPLAVQCSAHFVFPVTYGGENGNHLRELFRKLKASKLSYSFLNRMMSDVNVARLRISTDILINLQDTDQLSGAMQESLYCHAEVITGSWLPYAIFEHLDNIHMIDRHAQLTEKLYKIIAIRRDSDYGERYPESAALIAKLSKNSETIRFYDHLFKS